MSQPSSALPMCSDTLPSSSFFDLVVIGSGPAALAVVTRTLESRPAALYTEEEHVHLHWLRRSSISRPLLQVKHTGRGQEKVLDGVARPKERGCGCEGAMRILVIDRLGGWLANWNRLFAAYEIPHLRSPLFFNCSPSDVDSLVAYAERKGRTNTWFASDEGQGKTVGKGKRKEARAAGEWQDASIDLVEIPGCVGKEVSKHKRKQSRKGRGVWAPVNHSMPMGPAVSERDRRDYFTPSAALFSDFVQEDLVQRYNLDNGGKTWPTASDAVAASAAGDENLQRLTMVRGEVAEMEWDRLHIRGWDRMDGFSIRLSCGTRLGAKAVVCATGPGASPAVPPSLLSSEPPVPREMSVPGKPTTGGPGWCHSTVLGTKDNSLPPSVLISKEKSGSRTTLVVVGGGLTSAQICDVAIRRGISRVVLVMRGYMKVKPFDVGLEWIGRYQNLEQMRFWQEDDFEKRLEMLLAARNGGSITPLYAKLMKQYQEQGKLQICDCTSIEAANWNGGNSQWELQLARHQPNQTAPNPISFTLLADYIIAATGAAPRFSDVPFLSSIARKHGVSEHGGLPAISENLQYGKLPLFCTGAFSALQIGPGAFNLSGMRAAADRIAIRLQELAIGDGEEEPGKSEPKRKGPTQSSYTHNSFHHLPLEVEA